MSEFILPISADLWLNIDTAELANDGLFKLCSNSSRDNILIGKEEVPALIEALHKFQDEYGSTKEHSVEAKHYTWEEKIESLVKLAKAAGRFLNTDQGTEGYKATRGHLLAVYAEFCEWRHEEPYVVDEIKALLGQYEVSPLTGQIVRRSLNGE